MKINNVSNQNFKGDSLNMAAKFIGKHPGFIAGLAGCSVVAQKIVMSTAEAGVAPIVDIGVGKTISKVAKEKDDRFVQSSKVQAVRTCAQSTGGMITGVIIRGACIALSTLGFMKAGEKAGGKIAEIINQEGIKKAENLYKYTKNAESWGKTVGGAIAILVMMFTNFLLDVPLVNFLNKKFTSIAKIKKENKERENQAQEVKEAK